MQVTQARKRCLKVCNTYDGVSSSQSPFPLTKLPLEDVNNFSVEETENDRHKKALKEKKEQDKLISFKDSFLHQFIGAFCSGIWMWQKYFFFSYMKQFEQSIFAILSHRVLQKSGKIWSCITNPPQRPSS